MDPIKVKVGQTVEWANKDTVQHTVTSGTPGSADSGKVFDSGLTKLINPGATFLHKFDAPGTFQYYCQLHPTMTHSNCILNTFFYFNNYLKPVLLHDS